MIDNLRMRSPATARNREPILAVLRRVLPRRGALLEIASGSGEHAVWCAPHFPDLVWQPSDPDPAARASIAVWIAATESDTIQPPRDLDVTGADWGVAASSLAAIVCVNMIHIAPWSACVGLMTGAGRYLGPGGVLYLYGPFSRGGRHSAPSNEAFDQSLRARNPAWGVRDLDDVAELAAGHGLVLDEIVDMPANNLSVVFRKGQSDPS